MCCNENLEMINFNYLSTKVLYVLYGKDFVPSSYSEYEVSSKGRLLLMRSAENYRQRLRSWTNFVKEIEVTFDVQIINLSWAPEPMLYNRSFNALIKYSKYKAYEMDVMFLVSTVFPISLAYFISEGQVSSLLSKKVHPINPHFIEIFQSHFKDYNFFDDYRLFDLVVNDIFIPGKGFGKGRLLDAFFTQTI